MNPEQLDKLRIFESGVKARNEAKRVITSLEPIKEQAEQVVEDALENVKNAGKVVEAVEKATGWRLFFCCSK